MTRIARLTALTAALLALSACGASDDPGSSSAPDGPVSEITITSPDLSFDIEAFEVAVGEPVTITYENAQDGVAHNIRVDTGGEDEPVTEVERGVATQELTFTLDEPGEVAYLCDVHPQMRGTITASEPG